ncbi:MAG: type IX secretion system protein PorD, partial [Flavobacteriales bacterium]
MKSLLTIFSLFLMFSNLNAQELNCQVSIVIDAKLEITSVEREILDQLENTIYELMNNTSWTKDDFTVEERINCNVQLQIEEIPSTGTFKGSMQVQSSRPALNSSYNTTVFNFQDKDIAFSYTRNAALIFTPNQYKDNLTSLLAFYAFYVIGMDYDTFSHSGGTKYFQKAQQVVVDAQTSGAPGWKSNERGKRNRYWLVNNILQEFFYPLRDCLYLYHRKGIDELYNDIIQGRKEVYIALEKLTKVSARRPNSMNVLNFVQAKSNEIKNLYA